MTKQRSGLYNPRAKQRALCIAALQRIEDGDPLAELKELLRTAGVAVAGELVQQRPQPDPDSYLGRGKLDELKIEIKRCNANLVACDDELTPRQERNIEKYVGVPVVDRTAIILDIFASHASSAEGNLQVELAQLEYNMARMRGLWTHLERLGGGIGTRGPGETQIETDRRLARNRIKAIKRRIDRGKARRALMRKERESAALPTVALAGYTNAGKSTLLNALTDSDVSVAERLFETLDPTTRSFTYEGRAILLTDTVGFIRKLPHQLVDAFAATLEETRIADLILHVVDASEERGEMLERIETVNSVLDDIGALSAPRLTVFNKVDLVDQEQLRYLNNRFIGALQVSALSRSGLDDLKQTVAHICNREWQQLELLIPFSQGSVVNQLHGVAGDLKRSDTADGVRITARLPAKLAEKFSRFSISGSPR